MNVALYILMFTGIICLCLSVFLRKKNALVNRTNPLKSASDRQVVVTPSITISDIVNNPDNPVTVMTNPLSTKKWTIIPAEIKDDPFYFFIIDLLQTRSSEINNILEIGASSGAGSTEAIMKGKQGTDIDLYSLEVCTERFIPLKTLYAADNHFHPLNMSSVRIDDFPSKLDIEMFHREIHTTLNTYTIETVLTWYDNDISYIQQNHIEQDAIRKLSADRVFEMVLIDGSEFTGLSELKLVIGKTKFILLDDINAYKCYHADALLASDSRYKCLVKDLSVRNGFSAYEMIS